MMGRSHFAAGLAATAIAHAVGWVPASPALLALLPVAALLPDVDTPESTVGARVPFISAPLSMMTAHRGMTHSILAALAVFFVALHGIAPLLVRAGIWVADPVGFGLAMAMSYASHMVLDMVSGGAEALWPVMGRIGIKAVQTGSSVDYLVAIVLTGAAAWYWWPIIQAAMAGGAL